MKLKNLAIFLLLAIMILGGCSNSNSNDKSDSENNDPTNEKHNLLLGTSSQGGTYYIWGGGWADIIGKELSNVNVSIEVTGGPTDNIRLIENEEMELGFVTAWLGGEAYNGEGWADKNYEKIRTIFTMYPSVMHQYALQGEGIENIKDFEGKHITTGAPGSTSEVAGEDLLSILDIDVKDISKIPTDTAVDNLRDGLVDGGFAITGVPGPFMLDLETTKDVQHISLSDDEIDELLEERPYWDSMKIPEGTYKDQTEDTQVVAFWNVAVASVDLSEDLVYELVKTTFEQHEKLLNVDPTAKDTLVENITKTTIPLHVGAIKYFEEQGIDIPDELIPEEAR